MELRIDGESFTDGDLDVVANRFPLLQDFSIDPTRNRLTPNGVVNSLSRLKRLKKTSLPRFSNRDEAVIRTHFSSLNSDLEIIFALS